MSITKNSTPPQATAAIEHCGISTVPLSLQNIRQPRFSEDGRAPVNGNVVGITVQEKRSDSLALSDREFLSIRPIVTDDSLLKATTSNCPSLPFPSSDPARTLLPSASAWTSGKKWQVLVIVFIVQVSMNFNAASYGFAGHGIMTEFGTSDAVVRAGQSMFLITYAFGCELWAPFSEELGRKKIMQASLWLVSLFCLVCAVAPNEYAILVARALGGLSSAGGSVTLGIVADMYGPWVHQYALGFIVLSSCGGSVVGPLVGGPLKQFAHWRWVFWTQLIFSCTTALLHLLFCPETDERLLNGIAGERGRFKANKLAAIMFRPFKMLCTEYIVLALSLLSGFSDALVFTCFESYELVFGQWGFSAMALGLAFSPILIGNIVAYLLHCLDFHLQRKQIAKMARTGARPAPERRLKALLFAGPLLPFGLFLFGATSFESVPWAVPLFASALIGVANFAIYMTTIDYMVASYGRRYAASATGGNGFSRDLLAGISAWYAKPLYRDLGPELALQKGSFVLGCLATAFVIPVYLFYFKGEWFRNRSRMAEGLVETDAMVAVESSEKVEMKGNGENRHQAAPVSRRGRHIETVRSNV